MRRRLRANGAALPRLFSPRFPEPEKLGSGLLLREAPLHCPLPPPPHAEPPEFNSSVSSSIPSRARA